MAKVVQRIIEAQQDNVEIKDLNILLRKTGDRLNLLGFDSKGNQLYSLKEISRSSDLENALQTNLIHLYDEDGNRLIGLNTPQATAVQDASKGSIVGGPITYIISEGLLLEPGNILRADFTDLDSQTAELITDGVGISWIYDAKAGTLTGNVSLTTFTTSELTEGSNLYFTDERVDDRVSELIQDGTGISWVYNDSLGTLTPTISLEPFSTSDLSEGTNLYYTDERVDDRVSSLLVAGDNITIVYNDNVNTLTISANLQEAISLTDLSDVTITSPVDGDFIMYGQSYGFGTPNQWTNIQLTEYFNAIGISIDGHTHTSSDITDFDESVDDRVAALIQDGTGISWVYDDNANTLTGNVSLSSFSTDDLVEGSTNLFFTDERVDDRVSNLLVAGNNISIVYDDGANTLTISSTVEDVCLDDIKDVTLTYPVNDGDMLIYGYQYGYGVEDQWSNVSAFDYLSALGLEGGGAGGTGTNEHVVRWDENDRIQDSSAQIKDSGRLILESDSTEAHLELNSLASEPTNNLNEGQLSMINGELYFYDNTRSKWLSLQRENFNWGRRGNSDGVFLRFGGDSANIGSGPMMPFDGTIVYVTAKTSGGLATKQFDVYINGVVSFNFNLVSNEYAITTQDTDFSAGDELNIFVSSTGGNVANPVITLGIRWRP